MSSAFERTRDLSCQLQLVAVEDRSGHTVRFLYDDRGRLRHIVDSGGRIWELVYEPDSARIAELIGPDPGADTKRIVYARYFYDGRGNLCEVRDAFEQPQRFSYKRQLLVQETNRNGRLSTSSTTAATRMRAVCAPGAMTASTTIS